MADVRPPKAEPSRNCKDGPKLTMPCFDMRDAEVWITEAGPIRYACEVAEANATHAAPDVGGHTSLTLH